MAVKGLQALYNLILKDVVKGSGQASGIMSIGGDVRKLANKRLQSYITAAQKQGVDLDNMSEEEIKYTLELNKPQPIRAIPADSPEGQGITRDLFNMLDRQSGKNVIKKDFGKPFAEEKSVKELMESGQVQKGTQGLKKSDKVVKREMFEEANKKFNKTDEVVTVDSVITDIKKLEPIEAMKEANRILKGEGRYKSLSKADREKIAGDESVTDHIFEREIKFDPEDMAQGGRAGHYTGGMVDIEPNLSDIGHGSDALMARTRLVAPNSQATTSTGLNYLLAEDNDNIRVPFFKGGDAGRRAFLKLMGTVGAGIGAAKAGLGSLFKTGKPVTKAAEVITTPSAPGKPEWFDALVTKVIREGEDVTKKFATKEREIVHATKIDEDATVIVTRDLDEGTVRVDIDDVTTNVADDQGNAIVSMEVKEGEFIEPVIEGKYKGTVGNKTQSTFEAVETDYRNYVDRGGEDYTTEVIENVVGDTKDLTADLTKVKMYAKGQKKPTINEMMIQKNRRKTLDQAESNPSEYASDRQPDIDYSDYDNYASGGRIGFSGGKLAQVSARKFLEKVFGKEKFENMIRNDPEMHRGMLEVVEMFRNRDKERLKMYLQKFLPHMDDAQIENFIIGSGDTAGIEGQLIRLGSGRDYAGKIEMMKRLERNKALRDLDVTDEMIRKPNAEGGRIGLFLGGGLMAGKGQLRKLLEYMAKGGSHGKTPAEILQMLNPKQFNKILNDPATMGKFTSEAPEGIPGLVREHISKIKKDRSDMVEDLIETAKTFKKADDDIIKYKITVIEDMVSKGMDRKTAENMAETLATMVEQQAGKKATPKITEQGLLEMENIQKNLLTKDRKLQATGGLTTMLGE